MRISDWSSDVCSSDLGRCLVVLHVGFGFDANLLLLNAHRDDLAGVALGGLGECADICHVDFLSGSRTRDHRGLDGDGKAASRNRCTRSAETQWRTERTAVFCCARNGASRSDEHTSELQSLMRNSYAVFCLKKK